MFFVLHPKVPNADRHEYHITDDAIGVGTPGERYKNNVRAIRLLKKLEREERFATPEEQAVLAQYVGWGGLAVCFDERHSKYAELKALLDEDEYAVVGQTDSPQQIGPLCDILSDVGVLLVHRTLAGDKGDNAARSPA